MEVIKKGKTYKVLSDFLYEDEILVTDVSNTMVTYTVVKTKLGSEYIKHFYGMFSTFGIGSTFHSGLIAVDKYEAKKEFNKDLEEIINED